MLRFSNISISKLFPSSQYLLVLQVNKMTPAPGVIIVAVLSLAYLCSSDIFSLINYVGFATWISIGPPLTWIEVKPRLNSDIELHILQELNSYLLQIPQTEPVCWYKLHLFLIKIFNRIEIFSGLAVLCIPWLRWKHPEWERPIKVHMVWPVLYILATVFITVVPMIAKPFETGQ